MAAPSVPSVNYAALAPRVMAALRSEFPTDTIALEPGYLNRVHVKIVSSRFNELDEQSKQDIVWTILRGALGSEAQGVAFVIPYGTDEL